MTKRSKGGTTKPPADDDAIELLIQKFRWLRLPGMASAVRELLAKAAADNFSSTDVISRLCDEEKQSRLRSAVERRVRGARFPEINTIDAFDFDFDPVRKKVRARYLALHDLPAGTCFSSSLLINACTAQ